ncbi:MAG TPA: hypothetical protein VLE47_03185 [Candidatus Saccharimonadales bacterium]|nr:hypothetical protein [Candidatus Saccharimonadales bacterium]
MLNPANFNLTVRKISNLLLFVGFFIIVLLVGSGRAATNSTGKVQSATQNTLSGSEEFVTTSCKDNKNYDCYLAALKRLYDQKGPQETMSTLNQLSQSNDTIKRDCHPYAHAIGHYSFDKIGNALKAFSYGSTICASGYYHGVMEGFLTKVRNEHGDLKKEVVDLCDAKSDDTRFMQFQCLHGMGHGLTMYFNGDIMKSLPYCDSLKTSWDMQSCYGGVFMENIVAKDTPGHQSLYLKADQPEYPCNIVAENYKFSCYYLISSWFLQLTSYDYAKGFSMCDTVRSDFVWVCYQSMGRDISGATLRNATESEKDCRLGKSQFYQDCIVGVVKDFANTTAGTSEPGHFCTLVDQNYKKTCYSAAGQIFHDLYSDKSKFDSSCVELTKSEPEYKRNCLQES